jgi:broad specificity phosphatase PhoE
MTRVILIRHGQTDWNLHRRYQGSADIPLNSRGREDAGKLKSWVSGRKIGRVFTSDRKRASEFAKIAFEGYAIKEETAFREIGFGVFEGLVYEEAMRRFPGQYSSWIEDPVNTVIPDAETFSDFSRRVIGSLDRIVSENNGTTAAIVTHAGPIRVILNRIMKPGSIWDLRTDSGSIHIVEMEKGPGRVLVYNDTAYLKDE